MNSQIKILLQIIIITFFISCNKKEVSNLKNENDYLVVKLEKTINTDFEFDFRVTDFLMYSFKEKYPKYYAELRERPYNIPKLDSFHIVSYSFQRGKLLHDLTKNNYFESETDKLKLHYYLKDTTKMIDKKINHQVNAISGFKDGKQVIIVDTQGNNNYSDDEVIVFDKKIDIENFEKVNKLPIRTLNYDIASYDTIVNFKRKFQILPNPNHPWIHHLVKTKELRGYALLLKVKDYWKGEINIKNTIYDIAIQGENKFENNIFLIRPKTLNDNIGKAYNKNFIYYLNDTIKISDKLYKIDSIQDDMSKLILKKITKNKPFYSYRLGYTIKNFKLKSFDNKELQINDLSTKKYLLLDFWGTWCAPCKELTPELLRFNKDLADKIDILGIAYRSSLEKSKEYVKNNKMEWHHVYSKGREGIIRDLKIVSYPTFILLDDNRKIIYRGSGKEALIDIERFIVNN
ncbi:TlpA disulfide reductase family protein [Polaribacter sp. Z022]|uniref:TlpA family protein disulfide reductase n=1 Tax=Polaribacter sp. Z022 TaxID=2927125 RepID=UPI002021317E|nr:TlpA disulfide reductase family protein [Polaribacter sp. Z022]MCL7752496.1 TlpA family protein disulfide reductase [Polaribacter sp. Z022]